MKTWFKVFFLFFILGLLVYFNSLNNKFLIDDYVLLSNPVMTQTKFISSQWNPYLGRTLGVMEGDNFIGLYRPLSYIVYDFCFAVFKNNLWQYHLLNLFLFVLASSLIYLLIGKISGNYNLAFLAGLFYLIHPINGILVNYITSNPFTLLLIFMMGTILLLWESLERNNDRTLYFLSLLLSFLSLFLHELGMMTPLYVSAVILLFREGAFKTKMACLFPYFLIVFFYYLFRYFFLSSDSLLKHMAHSPMSGWVYLATLSRLMMWYIGRLFYPRGIVMQWVTPIMHEHIIGDNLGAISLLVLFILTFVRFAKERIGRLAIAWILIGFAPVCTVAFSCPSYVGAFIEPHWLVFSSIGFFILTAYFCLIFLDRMKKAGMVLLFIIILVWGSVSHANNQLWADQKTYTLYWSRQVPNFKRTYEYIADEYQSEGAFNESRKYFRMALTGHPSDDTMIYSNLGIIAAQEGNWKEAELNFRKVLEVNPYSASAYNNLGKIYSKQGQWDKAEEYYDQSLAIDPLSLEPRRNLASIYLKHSEYQKAIDLCLKNLDVVKDDRETLFLLIDIFNREKDLFDLKKFAYRLINVEIGPQTLMRLGVLMAGYNAPDIALDCFTKVIRLVPNYSQAYLATGTLFANLGKYDEAIRIWKIGSSIDPSDNQFRVNIDKAKSYLYKTNMNELKRKG